MLKLSAGLFLLLLSLAYITGCSSHHDELIAPQPSQPDLSLPIQNTEDNESNHHLLGTWTAKFDTESLTASISQNRALNTHYNVTSLIPPPRITVIEFNPITNVVDINVTIENNSIYDVYDVRTIIYTDDVGHMLLNPDDWTGLYDIPGGEIINSFIAYAKDQPNRVFVSFSELSENFQIYLPQRNPQVTFAINASLPGNCEEPYEISDFTQNVLYDHDDSLANVEITVKSWSEMPGTVYLHCPIITGEILSEFSHLAGSTYNLEIVNNTGAYAGNYQGWIVAYPHKNTDIAIYDVVTITVSPFKNGWAQTWGTPGNEGGLMDVIVDKHNNIYVCGRYEYTIDLDPGPGQDIHTSNGSWDTFVSKFNSEGVFIWGCTWGGPGQFDIPSGLELDNDQGLYISGSFEFTVDFDPGPDEAWFSVNFPEHSDAYLNKLDTDGNYIWTKTWGGIGWSDIASGVEFDGVDKIYTIGRFEDTVDFDPGSGSDFHTASGDKDAFLNKFDTDGNYYWVRTWGGSPWTEALDLVCDFTNSIYICGFYDGLTDFDPSDSVDQRESMGHWDAFLSKISNSGHFEWVRVWGDITTQDAVCITLDSTGKIYTGGHFKGTVDFDPGDAINERTSIGLGDAYVSKFTSTGDHVWINAWGDYQFEKCYGIGLDSSDNLYVTGCYAYIVDFDPGPDVCERTSNGETDVFLSRFTDDGSFIWTSVWGGPGVDNGIELITDNNSNIIVSGRFMDIVDFDPGSGVENHVSNGFLDAFVCKILSNGFWE